MHLTVLVWGFTAILGRAITLAALPLVWYRLVIVVLIMGALVAGRRLWRPLSKGTVGLLVLAGIFVALHWLLFYASIKYAGVAVGVLCLSTITFFTALFQPLTLGTRPTLAELLIGVGVMGGVALLVKLEAQTDNLGLAMGLGSALFSAGFGSLNGRLAREVGGELMTLFELSAALVVVCLFFLGAPQQFVSPLEVSFSDAVALLILAVGCTVLPWLWSLRVLRTLSPYTLALAVNLEPVYAMLVAYWAFPEEKPLGWRFYVGSAVLVALVALNSVLKRREAGAAPVVAEAPVSDPALGA